MEITQELLHELFEYRDGELYWKKKRHGINFGKPAGGIDSTGYRRTMIFGKHYRNHRLIFMMHYGYFPKFTDHIDNNPLNNRIENLRECTTSENAMNMRKSSSNTSGYKGISWDKSRNKWIVTIRANEKNITVGRFKDIEVAKKAAEDARIMYHGEFANHG